jgi:hypothetical protein
MDIHSVYALIRGKFSTGIGSVDQNLMSFFHHSLTYIFDMGFGSTETRIITVTNVHYLHIVLSPTKEGLIYCFGFKCNILLVARAMDLKALSSLNLLLKLVAMDVIALLM